MSASEARPGPPASLGAALMALVGELARRVDVAAYLPDSSRQFAEAAAELTAEAAL